MFECPTFALRRGERVESFRYKKKILYIYLAMNFRDILILISIKMTTLIWQENGRTETWRREWRNALSSTVSKHVASVFRDGAGYWTQDAPRTPANWILLYGNRVPQLNTCSLRMMGTIACGRGGNGSCLGRPILLPRNIIKELCRTSIAEFVHIQ